MHDSRFPGETTEYRAARDELLAEERRLRGEVERVAALRRRLPLGGLVPQDYAFEEIAGSGPRTVRLSELFSDGKDTLVLYGFMFAPDKEACPMCTSFLDGLNGNAQHVTRRVNLAVAAKSPAARLDAYARSRDWKNLRMLSWGGSTFGHDYHCELATGAQNTILHVFVRRPDGVHHFWSSELNMIPAEPGQNQRHIDMMWPLWNVLDTTPEGRGTDWFPRIAYE
jgi:predicted dithiol-disulfide oxidoreductase (DUF899 family)